jgi:hypothetical protein
MPREKSPTFASANKPSARKVVTLKSRSATPQPTTFVDPEKRAAMIAEAAFFRAEKRGFAPGGETADWLEAEQEVDARLLRADAPAART